MSEVKLPATLRTEFGKGAARRLRRDHQVPAVIYGHGTDPMHVSLPGHATMLALKQQNALLTLDLDGTPTLTLPKSVQRDPIKGTIEHVDLILVRRGERVTVDISVHVVGDAEPGTLITSVMSSLSIEAEATRIPQQIEVSVEGAAAGTMIHAGEIALPDGSILATDPEALVVQVSAASVEEAPEPAEAPAEA